MPENEKEMGEPARTCRIVQDARGKGLGHVCVLPSKEDPVKVDIIWSPCGAAPARGLRSTAELINELKKQDADPETIEGTMDFVDRRLRALDTSRTRRAV